MTSSACYFLLALTASLLFLTSGQHQKIIAHEQDDMCRNYMDDCNPWTAGCCKGFSCLNLRKGWCAGPPLERCVCQRDSYLSLDRVH